MGKILKQKILNGTSDGLSILISVVLISLIVLFSIGVATLVTSSTRQSANIIAGTKAYYAAESGIEMALLVNHKLALAGKAVGANKEGTIPANVLGMDGATVRWKIQGTTEKLFEKTVNGRYIIPFPWTGNVPWHGDGAIADAGGCDPQKPPVRGGEWAGKRFAFPGISDPNMLNEIDHPCNWGKLKVGEKAVVPLFGVNANGVATNFTAFTLRLRAPCKDGKEFCEPGERLELNCFDKGSGENRCVGNDNSPNQQYKKGEVIVAWEVDGEDGTSLLPSPQVNDQTNTYFLPPSPVIDTQLYEGKINQANSGMLSIETLYKVLDETVDGILGGDKTAVKKIKAFLSDSANIKKPVLKISVVGSLVGCYEQVDCSFFYDSPDNVNGYTGPNGIPYLEYQVILPDGAANNPPANKENIITAEGQFGAFTKTIQVKVPHDNSTLEYVIQQ